MNIALGSVREGIPFFTIQFFKRDFNGATIWVNSLLRFVMNSADPSIF